TSTLDLVGPGLNLHVADRAPGVPRAGGARPPAGGPPAPPLLVVVAGPGPARRRGRIRFRSSSWPDQVLCAVATGPVPQSA
ncbi:hypothetical protein, partial [Streptomyces sp. NPDC059604]|uniref:hypothetical protein n=1 Tax=Streptomyces sp. NPDC059604 TaxID=3346881 RepID=UPI0036980F5D